jgi:hypothetical protein
VILNRSSAVPLDPKGYYGDERYWSADATGPSTP